MNRYEFYGNINTYRKNQTNKENELTHYGTLGQKWGVRKWQNPDGTFNEAGKKRYFGTGKFKPVSKEEQKIGSTPQYLLDQQAKEDNIRKERNKILEDGEKYLDYDNLDSTIDSQKELEKIYKKINPYDSKIPDDPELLELLDMECDEIYDNFETKRGEDPQKVINNLSKEYGYDKEIIKNIIAYKNEIQSQGEDKIGSFNKKENKVDYDDILEKVYNNRFDDYNNLSKHEKKKLIKEIDKIRKDYENGKSLSDIQEDSEFDERKVLYAIDDLRRKNDNIIENPDEKTIKERNDNNEKQIQDFLKEKEDAYKEWGKTYYEEQFKDDPKRLQKALDGDEVIRKMTEDTIRNDQESYNKHLYEYIDKYGYDLEDIQDIQQTARAEYNVYKSSRGPLFYNDIKNKKFIDITKDEWDKLSESEKQSYEFAKHYETNNNWKCDNIRDSLKYSMEDKDNNIKWKVEYYPINDGSFNDRTKDSTQVYQNMDKYIKDFQKDFKSNLSKIEQNLKNSDYIPKDAKLKLEYINLASLRNTENEGFFPELEFDINDGEDSIGISINPKTLRIEDVG